ncbi:MAG: HAMP domain-containing histidine kinase [Cytophagales bacterium]|jgi:signal transduction histidine kinase|nr:HAMP domain-containing histidine kinase [Cytophagales bacterium]
MKHAYAFDSRFLFILACCLVSGMAQATPASGTLPSQLDDLQAENETQRWCLVLLTVLCLVLLACLILLKASRHRLVQNMHLDIERKSRELLDIQDQVHQANEELRVINTNLEGMVEERTLRLSKANRELDMFLYRASHDLRRPITTLMGLVEVAKLGFDEAVARMLFEKINDTAVNMDGMLEKFSMINTINHEEYECGEIDFTDIVNQIRQSPTVATYASRIHFDICVDADIRLISEPQLVSFILKNLIANSVIFHSRSSDRTPTVRLSVRQVGNTVGIELYDNGIGIPPHMLPEIFHLFYRGSEASKGNGLGLYVVRKAIEKLNGEIRVESEENKWTCVHITLPQLEAKTIALTPAPISTETLATATA